MNDTVAILIITGAAVALVWFIKLVVRCYGERKYLDGIEQGRIIERASTKYGLRDMTDSSPRRSRWSEGRR